MAILGTMYYNPKRLHEKTEVIINSFIMSSQNMRTESIFTKLWLKLENIRICEEIYNIGFVPFR